MSLLEEMLDLVSKIYSLTTPYIFTPDFAICYDLGLCSIEKKLEKHVLELKQFACQNPAI